SVTRVTTRGSCCIMARKIFVVADMASSACSARLAVVSTRSSSSPRRRTRRDRVGERCSLRTVSTGLLDRSEKLTSGSAALILSRYLQTPPAAKSAQPFEDHGHALAAADAHGFEAELLVVPLQGVDQGGGDPGAGHAERVADGDGAAVDVQLVEIDAEI